MKVYAKSIYAIKAIFEMFYNSPDRTAKIAKIAERQGIPKPFLEQIFNKLKRTGIIESKRGANGGYILKRYPSELTLGEVIAIFNDGKTKKKRKAFNIVDKIFEEGERRYFEYLNSITFEDLCKKARKAGIISEFDKSYIFSI